jgi:hypothetical protein
MPEAEEVVRKRVADEVVRKRVAEAADHNTAEAVLVPFRVAQAAVPEEQAVVPAVRRIPHRCLAHAVVAGVWVAAQALLALHSDVRPDRCCFAPNNSA